MSNPAAAPTTGHRRLLVLLALALLVIALPGAAHIPQVRADSDDDWIATVVSRADLIDTDNPLLVRCLRTGLADGKSRNELIGPCYISVVNRPDGPQNTSSDDSLDVILQRGEVVRVLNLWQAAIPAEVSRILDGLTQKGASQGAIDALREPLTTCILAWAPLVPTVDKKPQLDERIIDWCRQDLPDLATLLDTFAGFDAQAPVVGDLGCPQEIITGQPFTCNPRVLGKVTYFVWTLDGGQPTVVNDSTVSITLTLNDTGIHRVSIYACNTRDHCGDVVEPFIHASLPAPSLGSPGCPSTADPGQTFTCTASGFSPTDSNTAWLWLASAGGGDNSGGSSQSYPVTFPNDGTLTVTVTLRVCNGANVHCTGAAQVVSKTAVSGAPLGSVACAPGSGPAPLKVTCTPNLTNTDAATTLNWSATDVNGEGGNTGNIYVAHFDTPGSTHTITLAACNGNACSYPSAPISVDTGAPTGSIACLPTSGDPPLTVNCTAQLTGTIDSQLSRTIFSWTATGFTTSSSNSAAYSTTFTTPGNPVISLSACNGSACNTFTATVTVNLPPPPPSGTIACSPVTLKTGETVTCTANLTGKVTATTWTTPFGSPTRGTAATFSTSFNSTGTQVITLQACNGSACVSQSLQVEVFRKDPATPIPLPAEPPNIKAINCDLSNGNTGVPIKCTATIDAATPVTSYTWSATDGQPASGSDSSFSPVFSTAGQHTVSLKACNVTACNTQPFTFTLSGSGSRGGVPTIDGYNWNGSDNSAWLFHRSGATYSASVEFFGGCFNEACSGGASVTVTGSSITFQFQGAPGYSSSTPLVTANGKFTLSADGCTLTGSYTVTVGTSATPISAISDLRAGGPRSLTLSHSHFAGIPDPCP
jgi:PKD domain